MFFPAGDARFDAYGKFQMKNILQAARLPRLAMDKNSPPVRFWRWWTSELAALLPSWLRQSGAGAADALLIEITPQAIRLLRWQQDTLTEQGRVDRQSGDLDAQGIALQALRNKLPKRDDAVALWLGGAQCLVKQIELPLAAAKNLRQVLGFEMDRHTPFKAEQVYFDFRVLRVDNQNNRVTIRLAVVPRAEMDGLLALLARWGAAATSVYVAGAGPGGDSSMNLMPAEHSAAQPRARLSASGLALLLLVLLLAAVALAIPIWQKHEAVQSLLPIEDRAKQQAMNTDALRREQERLAAEYNFMLHKKQSAPPLVVMLDELSRLLPDDTWVQQLSIKGDELQIQGETGSSSRLIGLFESTRLLRDANFRSPLTKGDLPNSERYHLAVQIIVVPTPEEAAAASGKPANGMGGAGQRKPLPDRLGTNQWPQPGAGGPPNLAKNAARHAEAES